MEILGGEKFKEKFKQGTRWIILSAALVVVAALGGVFYLRQSSGKSEAVEVSVIEATKDRVEEIINESGTLELGGQQILKSPADGTVVEVRGTVGDRVRAGDPIVVLRDPERETLLRNHQLEAQQKELDLETKRQQLTTAREAVNLASAKINEIRNRYRADPETKLKEYQLQIQQKQTDIAEKRQQQQEAAAKLETARAKLEAEIRKANSESQPQLRQQQLQMQQQEMQIESLRQKVIEAAEDLAAAEEKQKEDEQLVARGFIAESELQDQKNTVRQARSSLREAELDVTNANIDLEKNRLQLQQTQSEIQDQIAKLRDEVAQAQRELRQAQLALKTATIDLETASLNQGNIREEIDTKASTTATELRQAEIELQEANTNLNNARDAVTAANIELDKHQLEREKIEETIQQNIVTAPIDGVVLEIKVKKGDVVKQADELLIQGNPATELVKLQISTLNAPKVRRGQLARVVVVGPEEKTFKGQVEELSLVATSGSSSSSSSGESGLATVSATVRLDAPSGTLIPGSAVNVEIIVKQRQNVVVLPTEAINLAGKEPFVWVQDNEGKAQKRPVTLGLEDVTAVEIASGLKEGDKVLVSPPDKPLEEGMKVTVKSDKSPESGGEDEKKSNSRPRRRRRG